MASPVEQIKEKLSIVDVVGSYVTLEKAGTNFKARCPFHSEKSASFFVSPARNSYYCFGCGAKGDIINFVEQFEGLDFVGALRVLAKRAGVELERENPKVRTEREKLYLMMEHATIFFQRNLLENTAVKDYLKKRGLTGETAKSWRIGYAPLQWKALSDYLKTKGFRVEEMDKVGLVKKSEKESGTVYDRFRGRIMFPIFDSSGRVIAFSGRQFESDGTEAKYLNSPETPLFEKSKILYGFDRAKLDIRRAGFALLVEGQMDLLMAHQAGFTHTVASSGTALTALQLELIKRLSPKVIICYDGDEAGNNAARRGFELALAASMDVRIVTLPEGKDPADLVLENPELFRVAIEGARHVIAVELDRIMRIPNEQERATAIIRELLPYVASIRSDTERSQFIVDISHKARIKEAALWEDVRKIEQKSLSNQSGAQNQAVKQALPRRQSLERHLWGIGYWQDKIEPRTVSSLDIKQKICNIIGKEEAERSEAAMAPLEDELVFQAETSFSNHANLSGQINDLLRSLEEEWLREELTRTMHDLRQAEREKDAEKVQSLLATCQSLSERLRAITEKPL
jgi:DNA primase